MNVVYIDAQNVHKSIQELGWIISREMFYVYLQKKFAPVTVKIFFGFVKQYAGFYKRLENIGFVVLFKETMYLPNGEIKGNVDIDIAIESLLDLCEGGLIKAYLVTGDGDYNTLVDLFRKRDVLGRVMIPQKRKASKLLKKSAGSSIQTLEDLRFFLEKKNPRLRMNTKITEYRPPLDFFLKRKTLDYKRSRAFRRRERPLLSTSIVNR